LVFAARGTDSSGATPRMPLLGRTVERCEGTAHEDELEQQGGPGGGETRDCRRRDAPVLEGTGNVFDLAGLGDHGPGSSLGPAEPLENNPGYGKRNTVKTRTSGLTMIEILVVVSIIAILTGLLLPAVHTVQKMARETKQKAQLTSIELALAAFKNDYGEYPPSSFNDPMVSGRGDYGGAQKLAEALLGWDLLGFHPNSAWRSDGMGLDQQGKPVATIYTAPDTLSNRRGRYLEMETANAFFLGGGTDGVFLDTSGDWGGGPLAPRTFVLCDVFPVRERKMRLPDGKIVSPGMPILYYKANAASKVLVPAPNEGLVQPEARVYNARDNRALVSLGMLADNAKPLSARRRHKLDPLYPLTNDETSKLYSSGDMFAYFYQLYIRDFRVQARPWPHRPDSYLLISAGADGIYGTNDDIRNFGQ